MLLTSVTFHANGQVTAGSRENLIAKADTLMEHEQYGDALDIYTKLLEKSKLVTDEDYSILYKRSYCFYALGKFQEALDDINRYLEHKPDQQAKLLRTYIYQQLGDNEAQLKDLNEFLNANPGNLDLIRWRASVLMELERYVEARKDIREILTQESNADIKAYLGLTYYYENDPDSALMIFDEILAQYPQHMQSYIYVASLALDEESYDLALEYINKGLSIETTNETLTFFKGIALVNGGKTVEGCRCLTKAFSGGIDDAGGYLKEFCYGVE